MKRLLGYLLLVGLLGQSGMAWAASQDRIVAVVNEAIITQSELEARATLTARAVDLDLTNPAIKRSLLRRTLTELVDETLQQQYAASIGVQLTRVELQLEKDQAISGMGEKRWAELTRGLAQAADSKMRAEGTWARLQQVAVAPRVQLGTAEIDKLIEEMSKTQNRTETNLSVIFLALDMPKKASPTTSVSVTEPDTGTRMMELRRELVAAKDGAGAFATMAKAVSNAPSAVAGGQLGWLTAAEIPSELATVIGGLSVGDVSMPIRTPEGWVLVRVNDRRSQDNALAMQPETQYKLFLLAGAISSDTLLRPNLEKALQQGRRAATTEQAVMALLDSASNRLQLPQSQALGWVKAEALQPDVAKAVLQTKPGHWTDILVAPAQLSTIFVAGTRQVIPPELLALRERVSQNLRASRTELEARRLMRELRQRAFVDIRL